MRIYTLPESHPLNKLAISSYRKRNTDKQPSPLRYLPRILGAPPPDSIEKITPPRRVVYSTSCFDTRIACNKDEALKEAYEDKATVIGYSDDSGFDGVAGAAAVLIRQNKQEPIAKIRFQLSPLSEHTTFDSESVGILLSLHLLQQHINDLRAQNCSASLDGRSVIKATQKIKMGSGQHIIEEIHRVARRMAKVSDMEKVFTLAWVPGHCGLRGNELADHEAKEATKNGSSGEQSLPHFLRKPLPSSVSAVKQ